jgi:hypothetical protein
MLTYHEQSHQDMRLYLRGDIDCIDQFNIITENTFTLGDFHIRYGILAESHFVAMSSNKYSYTEICACTNGIFQSPSLMQERVYQLQNEVGIENDQIEYRFKSKVIESIPDIEPDNKQIGHSLLHVFAGKNEHGDAYTHVLVVANDNQLIIRSIHTYPNENKRVDTESVFTFKN